MMVLLRLNPRADLRAGPKVTPRVLNSHLVAQREKMMDHLTAMLMEHHSVIQMASMKKTVM
jgi:hypothetical protein